MPTEEQKNVFLQELEAEKKAPEAAMPPNKKKSAIALFVVIFSLFILVIALFLFIMTVGGAGNPILKAFGVPEDGAKAFLLQTVDYTFMSIGVILLLIFSITLFIGFSIKKEEKLKKRGAFLFSGVSLGMIFLVVVVWLGMWNLVNMLVVEASPLGTVIEMSLEETENLKAPIDVSFSAEKIRQAIEKSGNKVKGFRWNFGDGFQPLSNSDTVEYRFTTAGKFEVQVEVIAESGETQVFPLKNRFLEIAEAEFSASPSSGNAPLRVEFNAENVLKGLSPSEFSWDFDGDGAVDETSKNPKIFHTFEQIGTYRVKLAVIETGGTIKRFERRIIVGGESADRVQAVIKTVPEILQGQPPFKVFFDASASKSADGKIVSYEWNFNDTTSRQKGETVNHTFNAAGTYNVELVITDEFGTQNTGRIEVVVAPIATAPQPVVRTTPKLENEEIRGLVPLAIKFDASGSLDQDNNIVRYEWDFDGDEEIDQTGDKVDYVFREAGEYEASLIITDADGNVGRMVVRVVAEKQGLQAKIVARPETGSAPLTVEFDASESWCEDEGCHINAFEWDFGDKTPIQSSGAQVKHFYPNVGQYEVKLTIYTDTDQKATTTKTVHVREVPLTSCFIASRTEGAAPLTVSFDPACAVGPVSIWEWDFGDGTTLKSRRPTHTFQDAGTYTIMLRVYDDKNNVDEKSLEIVVNPAQ